MSIHLQKKQRHFLPENSIVENWEKTAIYFSNLLNRAINSTEDVLQFIKDRSELDAFLDEEYRWRYVRQSCDTENEQYKIDYETFINTIMPNWMTISNDLNKKLIENNFIETIDKNRFGVYIRNIKKQIEIFNEKNIPIQQDIQIQSQEYGLAIGRMSILLNNEEITLPKAATFLQNTDRNIRKDIFEKINNRRLEDSETLNNLFSNLIQKRHQIAINAGFKNYRDYMFAELGRFDYGVKECEDFHEAIKTEVVPIIKIFHQKRQEALQLDILKPYDLEVETDGLQPLKPFLNSEELIEKSITCLNAVDPYFAACLDEMNQTNRLDLDSRKGKGPGGYNMSMPETGVPFVFMNAAGTQRDVETIVHEAGHSVHSFLMHSLPYNFDAEIPSEVAELASMSMELMTYDGLNAFYNDENKKRAIKNHLQGIIGVLPWIAIIDKFQHWIYLHPTHTIAERLQQWTAINNEYATGLVDWTNYEHYKENGWQKQLHLFEVPFYYIEYGIAQLGAIAHWKNYLTNKAKAIQDYKNALALGYTQPIPKIYETANIQFNFSKENIKELMTFVKQKLEEL